MDDASVEIDVNGSIIGTTGDMSQFRFQRIENPDPEQNEMELLEHIELNSDDMIQMQEMLHDRVSVSFDIGQHLIGKQATTYRNIGILSQAIGITYGNETLMCTACLSEEIDKDKVEYEEIWGSYHVSEYTAVCKDCGKRICRVEYGTFDFY